MLGTRRSVSASADTTDVGRVDGARAARRIAAVRVEALVAWRAEHFHKECPV